MISKDFLLNTGYFLDNSFLVDYIQRCNSNEFVEFNARFGGVPQQVMLPMASIVAIYARENGAGTVFDIEDAYLVDDEVDSSLSVVETNDKAPEPTDEPPKRRSHLTVVK